MRRLTGTVVLLLTGLLGLTPLTQAELVYGVTQNQFLVSWDSAAPGTLLSGVAIAGLASNESLVGIDFRPANGMLYGVGSYSRLYTVNPMTGVATPVAGGVLATALNGSSFGTDFNPVPDRLRIVSNADQNLRTNADTLAVTSDGTLKYALADMHAGTNPNIVHAAYTNSFPGATSTALYVMDAGLDILALQSPPNDGVLNTVGPLGTDVTEVGGFDISGATGKAFMVIRDAGLARSTFWSINLMTGAGTFIGEIGGGETISAMSIVPEPACGLLLLALAGVRRR